jgi:hypothetical protein
MSVRSSMDCRLTVLALWQKGSERIVRLVGNIRDVIFYKPRVNHMSGPSTVYAYSSISADQWLML